MWTPAQSTHRQTPKLSDTQSGFVDAQSAQGGVLQQQVLGAVVLLTRTVFLLPPSTRTVLLDVVASTDAPAVDDVLFRIEDAY